MSIYERQSPLPERVANLKPGERSCYFALSDAWLIVHPQREPLRVNSDGTESVLKPDILALNAGFKPTIVPSL